MKRFNKVLIAGLLSASFLIFGCSGDASSNNKPKPLAIEMMVTTFDGKQSEEEVKTKMDAVMKAYNVEVTEKNYEKCASALINLRKAVKGVSEMEIIDSMLESDAGKNGVSFPDQAALSAMALEEK